MTSLTFVVLLCTVVCCVSGLEFLGERETYAKFSEWNACVNASISFQFKTRQKNGLLMYTDDNGRYDYLQVALTDGAVRLWIHFESSQEQAVELELGRNLDDGRWHRVEVKRNRMETTLLVDSNQSSKVAFGADAKVEENMSHVYFGGIPSSHVGNLQKMGLPEDLYLSKFSGEIRNVLYFNCTCIPVRASRVEGRGIRDIYQEACDIRNPCPEDCPCISADEGPGCECTYRQACIKDLLASYHLPMDSLSRDLVDNPSGLDSRLYNGPRLVDGVKGRALRIDGSRQWLRVLGPGHKRECFGDLDRCTKGYYIGMWVKFENTSDARAVYMSNGGHSSTGHGVAMMYGRDGLEFVFKTKEGKEWTVKDSSVLPGQWYHVGSSWDKTKGLVLYVNGRQVDENRSPSQATAAREDNQFEDFVVGRSNDRTGLNRVGTLLVDEFTFVSKFMDDKEAMDMGAATHYHLYMDTLQGDNLDMVGGKAKLVGLGQLIPGKIGNALSLTGRGDFVDLGSGEGSCLGDLESCPNGFYLSFFVRFPRLEDDRSYVFSSPQGVSIYQMGANLMVTAQRGRGYWETRYPRLVAGEWYFVEVSWMPRQGLALYVNQEIVGRQGRESYTRSFTPSTEKRVFFGRGNDGSRREFAQVELDDVDIFFAGRDVLSNIGYIMTDHPKHYHFDFEDVRGNRLVHEEMAISLIGSPDQINGKIGRGLQLDGSREYVDFGDHSSDCFGNLDLCPHGILVAFWLRPDSLRDNMYFLSSGDNGLSLRYRGRRLHAMAETSSKKWEATSSSSIDADKWHYVEISFHPMRGLYLFVNNKRFAEDKTSAARTRPASTSASTNRFYLGRDNVDARRSSYAQASYDNMDVWFADRIYLTSHGVIQRTKPKHFFIKFEKLIGQDRLSHPQLSIRLVSRPRLIAGKVNNALSLRGRGQYADLGRRGDECMSNLLACKQGITIAAWMRFQRFLNDMVFLSTGENGILMKYRNGYLQVNADGRGTVTIDKLDLNRWYFIEISWHPETGLKVYVDNKLKGESPKDTVQRPPSRGSFYIGKKNHGDIPNERATTGIFDIDEMEIWYGQREDLIAFNYINRDNLGKEAFSFDSATGRRVNHDKYVILLVNGASLQPGRYRQAVQLNGQGQYVDLGEHFDKCFGNIDLCSHGMTVSMWLYPEDLRDGTTFLSTPTYNLFYEDGRLNSLVQGKKITWATSSTLLRKEEWQRITLAWHPKKGLTMYINDELVSQDRRGTRGVERGTPASRHVYLGRDLESDSDTANMLADELQVWYDDLDQLRATGQYQVQVVPRSISFENWNNNHVVIRDRKIQGHGDIQITRGKGAGTRAIYLPGGNTYLDLGSNFTCSGDLETCRQGATIRLGVRPMELRNGMYFLDSWPVRLYYQNGRLHGILQTADKVWKVDTTEFSPNKWQRVELTWHPRNGLTMFIDGRRVDYQINPLDQKSRVPEDWRTYFGRALQGGQTYANTAVDNIEFWQAYRDSLPEDAYTKIIPAPEPTTPRPTYGPNEYVTADPRPRPQYPNDTQYPGKTNLVKVVELDGQSMVHFDLGRLPPEFLTRADNGEFQFYFKTDRREGLIWSHEEPGRRMYLALKNSHLVFVNDNGSGSPDIVDIGRTERARFDDGKWHYFKVTRVGRKITLRVDDLYPREYSFSRPVQFLTRATIHLGGSGDRYLSLDNRAVPNFAGQLALIFYTTKSQTGNSKFKRTVNILAKINDPDVQIVTVTWPTFSTRTTPRPTTPKPRLTAITIKKDGVHLATRTRFQIRNDSGLSFKFQTIKDDGIVMYSTSNQYGRNFFALELYDGKLYFIYNFGGKTHRTLMSEVEVADGQQHEVKLGFFNNYITLQLDRQNQRVRLRSPERLPRSLGQLFIGGYNNYKLLPWYTWARDNYQGCLEDLKISGQVVDLHSFLEDPRLLNSIEKRCIAMPKQCSILQPCGKGQCIDSWDGFSCNCQGTSFRGDRCQYPAWTAVFNGSVSYKMTFQPQQSYHVNDITLRFMSLHKDGLLFQTRARDDGVFMRAELKNGRVVITTNLGGPQQVMTVGEDLKGLQWHNLNIRRRGNQLEAWIDDDDHDEVILPGEGYFLNVDDVYIGGNFMDELPGQDIEHLIGYIQNMYLGGYDILDKIQVTGGGTFYQEPDIPRIIYQDVTFPTYDSNVKLPPMKSASGINVHFMFKTMDNNGLILLNEGVDKELFVTELFDKRLRLKFAVPNKPTVQITTPATMDLSDNKWHSVSISNENSEDQKQLSMMVDDWRSSVAYSGMDPVDLAGPLYVGGLPLSLFKQENIKEHVMSKSGFRGCMATFVSRGLQNLYERAQVQGVRLLDSCQKIPSQCTAMTCRNGGVCHDHINNGTTWCDCSMTGYAGQICEDEPLGYYFANNTNPDLFGGLIYNYPSFYNDHDSNEIVLGVMTYHENAVLTKLISDTFPNDFIQLRLVDGHVVAEYGTDDNAGTTTIMNSDKYVSNGNYHVIRFIRTANNGTLYVDGFRTFSDHLVPHGQFNSLSKVFVGGVMQAGKVSTGTGVRGIVAGLNVNGELILPYAKDGIRTDFISDVVVAKHPFKVHKLKVVVPPSPTPPTPKPGPVTPEPPIVIPVIPGGVGGAGIAWSGVGGGDVIVYPDGGSGSAGSIPGGFVGGPAEARGVAAVASVPVFGARAGALMGTLLGLMVLASSLMWAFYKCKPGMCPCCAAAGGGKAGGAVISGPRAASNMGAVQAATAAGTGSGAGAGALASADGIAAGAGGADVVDAPDAGFTPGAVQTNTLNGGTRLAGGGTASNAYYYSQQSSSNTHHRGDSYDSATLRAMGTFSNKGTAIGTPRPARAQFGSTASASGYSMSEANQSYHFEGNSTADYDVAMGVHAANANYQSNTLGAGSGGGGGFSTATMSSNYNYSVKTIKTVGGGGMGYGGSTSNIIVTPGAMGEEVRVDCCLMTNDGHSVVTGSSLGPPQVWNMSSGELLRIMQGETVGSTFLHLVNGDRLLVGAINADLEINQYSVPKGVHNYVFQIWDFASGRPMDMAEVETCSALTIMNDSDKVVFARSDKFGGGTNVVVWDLMGNQPIKEMRYDAPVGNNDYVSYVAMSQSNRFVVTGFTNTFDNFAEFVIFDVNQSAYNITDPNILRLDALPECTAILPRDEAVTGLRNGDLVVWSLVTGQPSRQLLANNGKHAHSREVKAVVRSKDSRYLVSASADGTMKLWDLETERQLTTMSGHSDEVWCCAISEDNEIVVSGSRDGTIRLWRLRNGQEICSFNAGVDVFYITMSRDKGTIVALGDKFGARKLVMLQVVRSKVKRQVLA